MPKRIRGELSIGLERFLHDDGVGPDPYFGESGYPNAAAAERAWQRVRRDVWLACRLCHVPKAAIIYDGLQSTAHAAVWHSADAKEVAGAVREDLAAVDAFTRQRPEAARELADILHQWRADLRRLIGVAGHPAEAWTGSERTYAAVLTLPDGAPRSDD